MEPIAEHPSQPLSNNKMIHIQRPVPTLKQNNNLFKDQGKASVSLEEKLKILKIQNRALVSTDLLEALTKSIVHRKLQ